MRLLIAVVALSALLVTGGNNGNVEAPAPRTEPPAPSWIASPAAADLPSLPETTAPDPRPVFSGLSVDTLPETMTLVAMMSVDTQVYEEPDDLKSSRVVPATTIVGTPTVLAIVEGPDDGWAKVMLPGRPNGSLGWVRTDKALLYVVEGEVVIDLSEKKLTYYKRGETVLTTTVAIGSQKNPTPTGRFFVTDNVTLADPNSLWGPHAFGLSARSDTITEYRGGDGIIGIHGTVNPTSIGHAASLGCVRVHNDVITELHQMIPIGTPVLIEA